MLEILVHEIRGECPVYKVGDKITIDEPEIILEKTDALCTHALSTLLHYVTILEHNWCPEELGLTTPDDPENAYMQCVDPGKPYTEGATVIFRCRRIPPRETNKITSCS
ncbi:MAG: TIGR04076 family protein [Deltaproteobacteria bacterium]|nr:TIGR04076 family protein [Deltaproteobacteria bacterium]